MSDTLDDFIARELTLLEAYDNQRPAGHPYAFHLHVRRVADDMARLAVAMGMAERSHQLHMLTLAHDIGKRKLPVAIWDVDGKPNESVKNERRKHTQLGVDILNDAFGTDNHDPRLELLRDLMANHHESIDGSGWLGKTGDDLSLEAKMLCVCDAFDGYSSWRPHFGKRDISPAGVLHRMSVEKAGQFDPAILKTFAAIKTV